jgi:sporulation integral membrane protein YtvI
MPHGKALIITAAVSVLLYFVFKLCIYFFSPFLVAVLISIIIEAIIKLLMRNIRINRTVSTVIALMVFCGLFLVCSYYVIYTIYREIMIVVKDAPRFYDMADRLVQSYYIFMKENFNIEYNGQSIINMEKIANSIMSLIIYLKDMIIRILNSLPDIIIYFTFSIIAAFFISRDRDKILELLYKFLPVSVTNITSKLFKSTVKIVKTECVLIGISTIQSIIGFYILGIDYAFLLGIICGILDVLPVVGPGFVFIPWCLYAYINRKIALATAILCLYIIIMVTRQILEARMISGKLNLHPLIILMSIYIGLKFFGVTGAIIGPLITVMLKEIYEQNICKE